MTTERPELPTPRTTASVGATGFQAQGQRVVARQPRGATA